MTTPTPLRLRLASYNVRKCRGTDGKRAPGRVLDVINGLSADIVALQEVDRRLGDRPEALPARMIEDHSDYRVVRLATSDVSLGWHGNALLVRAGIEVRDIARIDLPGVEPRGAVTAQMGGLRVVAVHLGLLRRSRRAQLQQIRAHLAASDPGPTLILGDFNEWSTRRGLEPLDDGFRVVAPGRSFHAARPIAALDRFALSERIDLRDAGVVETPTSRTASDHLPIWADIEVTG